MKARNSGLFYARKLAVIERRGVDTYRSLQEFTGAFRSYETIKPPPNPHLQEKAL
jgi:hypothetical protein